MDKILTTPEKCLIASTELIVKQMIANGATEEQIRSLLPDLEKQIINERL